MADSSELYQDLDQNQRQIRLIAIDRSTQLDETVQCRMITVGLDTAPQYKTLSYTWGDTPDKNSIWINGITVQHTDNLIASLKRLRNMDDIHLIWIDAICINQSNAAEKSHQVPLMTSIYHQAQETIVWLGETADDSDHAIQTLQKWWTATEEAALTENSDRCDEDFLDRIMANVPDPFGQREWSSLASIFQRPYWRRVWILQEIALSKNVLLVCGTSTIDILCIYGVYNVWKVLLLYGRQKSTPDGYFTNFRQEFKAVLSSFMLISILQEITGKFSLTQLVQIIATSSSIQFSNPRDSIYGLLGLVSSTSPNLKIDHGSSVIDVFIDYAEYAMQTTSSLDPLFVFQRHASIKKMAGLPSWAPDHTARAVMSSVTTMGGQQSISSLKRDEISVTTQLNRGRSFDASKGYTSQWETNRCRGELKVSGIFGDEITACCPRLGNGAKPIATILKAWWTFLYCNTPDQLPSNLNLFQTFFRTIIMDGSGTGPPYHHFHSREAWEILLSKLFGFLFWMRDVDGFPDTSNVRHQFEEIDHPDNLANHAIRYDDPGNFILKGMTDFQLDFEATCQGRTLFVSSKGYIGLGPFDMQRGDAICVLYGLSCPVILRKMDDYYKIIDDCYVYGLMNGQLTKEVISGRKQHQIFSLR